MAGLDNAAPKCPCGRTLLAGRCPVGDTTSCTQRDWTDEEIATGADLWANFPRTRVWRVEVTFGDRRFVAVYPQATFRPKPLHVREQELIHARAQFATMLFDELERAGRITITEGEL